MPRCPYIVGKGLLFANRSTQLSNVVRRVLRKRFRWTMAKQQSVSKIDYCLICDLFDEQALTFQFQMYFLPRNLVELTDMMDLIR